jgi:threonyl-tRNA synthetase
MYTVYYICCILSQIAKCIGMINIALPGKKVLSYDSAITGFKIAEDISKSLSKNAIALSINGELVDLDTKITSNATVKIITSTDKEGLEIIRHSAAHILAQAIKHLFPDTQITIGPVIEDGFYYDVLPKEPFSIDDLKKFEKEMHKIVSSNLKITRELWNRDDAVKFFKDMGENFKAEIIADIPSNESISLYKQGDFIDLCKGPHVPSTKFVKHFKLMKVAGAYWRGDSKNPMLQRIYGTAWATKEDLDTYLHRLEEAERRDHRKIAKQMDLFHIQVEAPGMIFWHPNGWIIYKIIEEHVRKKLVAHNYKEVSTPILVDRVLWEKSGHWDKFREHMFTSEDEEKGRIMGIKPMNCPCHIEIFKTDTRSYRDLPMRMAEFGSCHRNEPSGSLHGLMRVRGMTQDDGHIFCTEDQIIEETIKFTDLVKELYKDFGFTEIIVNFSDRPEVSAGSDKDWKKAESCLKAAIEATGMKYQLNKGEGAFYGPKIEFVLKDAIGREWQCGTLQVDCVLPERLEAYYIDEDGTKKHPVILHRAALGSLERFIGILIENYEGKFPLWLAPIQISILTITTDVEDYASIIKKYLDNKGYRSSVDNFNEKINYKIRKHSLLKTPIMVIIGREEKQSNSIAIREFGSNDQISFKTIEEFNNYLQKRIAEKS